MQHAPETLGEIVHPRHRWDPHPASALRIECLAAVSVEAHAVGQFVAGQQIDAEAVLGDRSPRQTVVEPSRAQHPTVVQTMHVHTRNPGAEAHSGETVLAERGHHAHVQSGIEAFVKVPKPPIAAIISHGEMGRGNTGTSHRKPQLEVAAERVGSHGVGRQGVAPHVRGAHAGHPRRRFGLKAFSARLRQRVPPQGFLCLYGRHASPERQGRHHPVPPFSLHHAFLLSLNAPAKCRSPARHSRLAGCSCRKGFPT